MQVPATLGGDTETQVGNASLGVIDARQKPPRSPRSAGHDANYHKGEEGWRLQWLCRRIDLNPIGYLPDWGSTAPCGWKLFRRVRERAPLSRAASPVQPSLRGAVEPRRTTGGNCLTIVQNLTLVDARRSPAMAALHLSTQPRVSWRATHERIHFTLTGSRRPRRRLRGPCTWPRRARRPPPSHERPRP